jgi:hypothetical protein
MKIDGRAVMGAVAKSTGHAFDFFYLGVDRLPQCIGDAMLGVEKIRDVVDYYIINGSSDRINKIDWIDSAVIVGTGLTGR